jgi:hypothetical protein
VPRVPTNTTPNSQEVEYRSYIRVRKVRDARLYFFRGGISFTYLLFDEHLDGIDGDLESRLPVALGTSQVLLHRGIDVQDHYYCFLKYN